MFGWFNRAPSLESYSDSYPRDVLIQSGRVLFVDDELSPLISDLQGAGFSINHDTTGHDYESLVINQFFDVAIIDYKGVGMKYGSKQGLDLMRFVRRVSPRTRIIAFTSQGIGSDISDFYRLADVVLAKDAGVNEALECVENQIQRAFSKTHLFDALIKSLNVSSSKDRGLVKESIEKALKNKDQNGVKIKIKKILGSAADKGIDVLLAKIFME